MRCSGGKNDLTTYSCSRCGRRGRCRQFRQHDFIARDFSRIYVLFMLRPQQKEQKKKNAMLAALEVGDTVLTTSGFYGTIIDISDDTVIVEFGSNKNCRILCSARQFPS